MKKMNHEALKKIHGGGGSAVAIGFLIAAGVVFIIGVIDGYFRPLKCNK